MFQDKLEQVEGVWERTCEKNYCLDFATRWLKIVCAMRFSKKLQYMSELYCSTEIIFNIPLLLKNSTLNKNVTMLTTIFTQNYNCKFCANTHLLSSGGEATRRWSGVFPETTMVETVSGSTMALWRNSVT